MHSIPSDICVVPCGHLLSLWVGAQDLLAKIADVKTGALPSWERIGNAYRLYLSADGALIEDLVDPPSAPQRVPLEELKAAMTVWIEAVG
jgi:hypothetical protein